jgi:hypothetical protein
MKEKIKWLIKELMAMYSDSPSYFSKKRVESGIAFIIMQWGMITYLINHWNMDMYSMVLWAGVEATICGYTINQIQKEKLTNITK